FGTHFRMLKPAREGWLLLVMSALIWVLPLAAIALIIGAELYDDRDTLMHYAAVGDLLAMAALAAIAHRFRHGEREKSREAGPVFEDPAPLLQLMRDKEVAEA